MADLIPVAIALAFPAALLSGRRAARRTRSGFWPAPRLLRRARTDRIHLAPSASKATERGESAARRPEACLAEWPAGVPARIVRFEGDASNSPAIARSLLPGQSVEVIATGSDEFTVRAGHETLSIHRSDARRVRIGPERSEIRRLSSLRRGETARIHGIASDCSGLARRRLLDIGLTPGTWVSVTLDNTFGDPRAFRVRGTTVALRRQQADKVWVADQCPRDPEEVNQ